MAKHMRPPRRRTGRILRGIVTHACGRVGPRRRANPPGGRIISTRELTYVRRRLTVLIAMFSVVTMVVLLSVRGCSNDGDGSSGSVSSAGAARSGATVDPTGTLVDIDSSQVFASASTYKLFVAHSMVTAVELGEMTWDSPLNGMTLQQCLTTMIVDSDNECPKAWLMRDNGAGYDKVTQQANALGAKNTTLHYLDVRTTSADLALILTKLYRGEIWNDDDRDMVIGLMKRQQYRSGIPAGIGGNGTVADKVGFRDSYLHDAGIVYSGKGDYAFVIMTSGSSWTAIANASAALYQLL